MGRQSTAVRDRAIYDVLTRWRAPDAAALTLEDARGRADAARAAGDAAAERQALVDEAAAAVTRLWSLPHPDDLAALEATTA